jgi:hypothetical protein
MMTMSDGSHDLIANGMENTLPSRATDVLLGRIP